MSWIDRVRLPPRGALRDDVRGGLLQLLDVKADQAWAVAKERERLDWLSRLRGLAPAGAPPEEMRGYLEEAVLRFAETLALAESLDAISAGRRILEIGANPYFFSWMVRQRAPAAEWIGLNYFGSNHPDFPISESTPLSQRLVGNGFSETFPFYHVNLEAAGVPRGAWNRDTIFFCEVLEHLPYDPAFALYSLWQALEPGGMLILSTPNPARSARLIALLEGHSGGDPISGYGIYGRHNREYSRSELLDLLGGLGFEILTHRTIDVHPAAHSHEACRKGFGDYHLLAARRSDPPRGGFRRPAWLYSSFPRSFTEPQETLTSAVPC